jgi:hypothetical protein
LVKNFKIHKRYQVLYVLALGKPYETVIIDELKRDDIKYWRDKD